MDEHLSGDGLSATNFSLEMINEDFLRKVPFRSKVFEDLEGEIAKHMTVLDSYTSQIINLPASEDHPCLVTRGKLNAGLDLLLQ